MTVSSDDMGLLWGGGEGLVGNFGALDRYLTCRTSPGSVPQGGHISSVFTAMWPLGVLWAHASCGIVTLFFFSDQCGASDSFLFRHNPTPPMATLISCPALHQCLVMLAARAWALLGDLDS